MFCSREKKFISGKEVAIFERNCIIYLRKRLKLKYPVENMCTRHFQGVFLF
jgi:hypothetical protein